MSSSTGRIIVSQVRFQVRTFMRIPVAAFFTLALPLVMLVLINALLADGTVETGSGEWPAKQFYTVSLAAFAVVSATYTNFANIIPVRRDQGVLKRWRSTPLRPSLYVVGMIGSALVIAVFGAVLLLGVGVAAYDLQVEAAKLPAAIVVFVAGVCAFAALGVAVGSMIPSPAAAPAIANGTILPLAFISNVFIPLEDPSRFIEVLGDFFPLKPFVTAFQDAFNPAVESTAIPWSTVGWLAIWTAFGVALSVRYFTWAPKTRSARVDRQLVAAE